jgi:Tol biopolymer transport system component
MASLTGSAVVIALSFATPAGTIASLPAPTTTRVSVSGNGEQGNGNSSLGYLRRSVSADGRFVAFWSGANNLVSDDHNGYLDVFLHDLHAGTTTRVSVASDGDEANADSSEPCTSYDGRFIAFCSNADNLVGGDTNGAEDVFVHDRRLGMTMRVSVDSAGNQGDGGSCYPSLSADGRYVAFMSFAANLVTGDANGVGDVFLHDRLTGVTSRVSVDSSGIEGNDISRSPSISADGRYIAFDSWASNLVPGDPSGFWDVFVRDVLTGITTMVSVNSSGDHGNSVSLDASISADGRFVAFESIATNLVPGDTNGHEDVFVHDREAGATTRVSVDSLGHEGNGVSRAAAIAAGGWFVAFCSDASDLVSGDTNGHRDVFLHDRRAGTTTRVSVDPAGDQGDGDSFALAVSADGGAVVFASDATDLVGDDTNGFWDVFVRGPLDWPLFYDGFQSGDTAAWSWTVP